MERVYLEVQREDGERLEDFGEAVYTALVGVSELLGKYGLGMDVPPYHYFKNVAYLSFNSPDNTIHGRVYPIYSEGNVGIDIRIFDNDDPEKDSFAFI